MREGVREQIHEESGDLAAGVCLFQVFPGS